MRKKPEAPPPGEPEPNVAKRAALEEAERLRKLGWSDEQIDEALGAWR